MAQSRSEFLRKKRAQVNLKYAVDCGLIQKASVCEKCGYPSEKIHGHHPDYSMPRKVEWLCPTCHKKQHANNNSDSLFRNYRLSLGLTQKEIGELLDVTIETVSTWENKGCPKLINHIIRLYPTFLPPLGVLWPSQLKTFRKERNLTQKQLATIMGVGKSTIQTWEYGVYDIPRIVSYVINSPYF